jgi:hypothetical protein
MGDAEIDALGDLLMANHNIWAVNVGETVNVSKACWLRFYEKLDKTSVTHMYVSEEELRRCASRFKGKMIKCLSGNRNKHNNHIDPANEAIIRRITHMWK